MLYMAIGNVTVRMCKGSNYYDHDQIILWRMALYIDYICYIQYQSCKTDIIHLSYQLSKVCIEFTMHISVVLLKVARIL